jgi:hypothetical protein
LGEIWSGNPTRRVVEGLPKEYNEVEPSEQVRECAEGRSWMPRGLSRDNRRRIRDLLLVGADICRQQQIDRGHVILDGGSGGAGDRQTKAV